MNKENIKYSYSLEIDDIGTILSIKIIKNKEISILNPIIIYHSFSTIAILLSPINSNIEPPPEYKEIQVNPYGIMYVKHIILNDPEYDKLHSDIIKTTKNYRNTKINKTITESLIIGMCKNLMKEEYEKIKRYMNLFNERILFNYKYFKLTNKKIYGEL